MNLPFVIFASESTVDQLTDGSRVVNIVQDDDQRYVRRADVPVDLIGQVGQIELQILREETLTANRVTRGPTKQDLEKIIVEPLLCFHLAGLAVHVEGDHDAVGDLASTAIH